MANLEAVTDAGFGEAVAWRQGVVVVDFWAAWCPPCRALGPVIDELAQKYKGTVKVGKLDADANRRTVVQYDISSLPTILLFKNGKAVDSSIGLQGKAALELMIRNAVG